MPCAFAFDDTDEDALVLYSALDEKPKSVADPHDLARVRDTVARPRVTLIVDRWSEDWTELTWLRLDAVASLLEPTETTQPEHSRAVELLRARYPQYATQDLEARPILRFAVQAIRGWTAEAD